MKDDVYTANNYADREDYLNCLADKYDTPIELVAVLAELLGPSEDFDGLVNILEECGGLKDGGVVRVVLGFDRPTIH